VRHLLNVVTVIVTVTVEQKTRYYCCLAGIFITSVDDTVHALGTESDVSEYEMRRVDALLYQVIEAVEEAGDINLVVFSDHGGTDRIGGAADPTSGLINILDYINETDWEYAVGSSYDHPIFHFWPKPGNEEWVSFELLDLYNCNFTLTFCHIGLLGISLCLF